jgi:surface antigen
MSNQDTGLLTGALAGGLLGSTLGKGSGQILAIAAGTAAGAMIGGSIGKNMDDTDRMRMNRALEGNSVGEPAYWHNRHTGVYYRVVPTRNVRHHGNRYCREYRTIAEIGGKTREVYGTACRDRYGDWRIVN